MLSKIQKDGTITPPPKQWDTLSKHERMATNPKTRRVTVTGTTRSITAWLRPCGWNASSLTEVLGADNLDGVCDHLDLISGCRLASISQSVLGLGDRLRSRADKSVQKIQRAFRLHYCWPLGLRAMAKTLNPVAVAFQAQRAKDSILKRLGELALEETWNPERAEAASKQMTTFVTITHEVCAETMRPLPALKKSEAVACVDALIKVLLELGDDDRLGDWYDTDGSIDDDQVALFVETFPPGDEITSLKVYLAQMQVWNGWCSRGHEMMEVILEKSGLWGCALTFFSLHGWNANIELDVSSMYQNSGSLEEERYFYHVDPAGEDDSIIHEDPDEMLARLSNPKHVHCPLKRGLFQAIREKRNSPWLRHLEQANKLAMSEARNFVEMHEMSIMQL